MKTNTTEFDVQNHVAWITLNRPHVMNALNIELKWQLSQHLDEIERREDIWVAVITGAGERAFSAGADLKERASMAHQSEQELTRLRSMERETHHIVSRWEVSKPIIAMVNGVALGGGFEVALACDIIVAADHAEFGLPEPKRGLIAGSAGVHRLPRQIGLKPAMGYLLTGRHFSAARAFELGLVNDVVPLAVLRETTERYVEDILQCAPLAVRATKASSMQGLDLSLRDAFNRTYPEEVARRNSLDAIEGPKAFSEKRPPRWQGK